VIGGVCGGLAAYFNIDTVWVRLAMFLLIFFGGLSLWVYIILWIVIPEAKTTADKFAMRGEAANINNIFRSFKEEAVDVKNRFGKEFRDNQYGERIRSNAADILGTFFNILGRLIGLFLVLLGTVFLLLYAGLLLGISIIDTDNDISNWKAVIFDSGLHYNLAVFSFIVVIGIPVFMILYSGIKLLFRIRYSNRWLNLGLGVMWLFGLFAGIYVTMLTVKQFNQASKIKESVTLKGIQDTVLIKLNPVAMTLAEWEIDNKDDLEAELASHHSGYRFGGSGTGRTIIGYANLDVVQSTSDSVELMISYSSRGETRKQANDGAREIKYKYLQKDNELLFDEVFKVTNGTKFRNQEVSIKLKIPVGMVIYLDHSVKYLLDEVDNTSNTWDGDMVGRRWKMTARGLQCIDCANLHQFNDMGLPLPPEPPLPPDPDDRRSHVKIDNDGIRIRSEDANVDITSDGINVNTREKRESNK
jgi:phage shock protein PspC (stress-responsive transcriptional regulator)